VAKKPARIIGVNFPTGLVLWLDAEGRLGGSSEESVRRLGKRELAEEPNAFEVFLKTYIANNGKLA